jgi:cytochrome c oxidase subunit 1
VALMIALTLTNYGYPILNLALSSGTSVPAVYVGAQ